MSSNKEAKEELIRRYGNECFIEKLNLRTDTNRKYTGKAQYKRMKQLTYHHIKKKEAGGKATKENGALLSEENHIWFNNQPKIVQDKLNDIFQTYKHLEDLRIELAELTTNGVEQVKEYKIEEPKANECISISVYENTPEDIIKYREYKKQRNQRILKKFEGEERC